MLEQPTETTVTQLIMKCRPSAVDLAKCQWYHTIVIVVLENKPVQITDSNQLTFQHSQVFTFHSLQINELPVT